MEPSPLIQTDNTVTIYVKKEGNTLSTYVNDLTCMKAAFESFQLFTENSSDKSLEFDHEARITLHLPTNQPSLRYIGENGKKCEPNTNLRIAFLGNAAESVLKELHKKECVGKNLIPFQVSWGSFEEANKKVSGINIITLNNPSSTKDEVKEVFFGKEEGIVSRVYADTHKREMRIFLNNPSQDTMEKIRTVLAKFFPEKK